MSNKAIRWIICGDASNRKTRLHNERGDLVPLTRIHHAFFAFATTVLRIGFGYRPKSPWISYSAQWRLSRFLTPSSKVLEFGSGFSTLWLAKHAQSVVSIEHDATWYRIISEHLKRRITSNVTLQHRSVVDYCNLTEYPNNFFDLILIDGIERNRCAEQAIAKCACGGYVYLDNTDAVNPDYRQAAKRLLQASEKCSGRIEWFTDFVPTSFIVTQGLLVQL